MNCLQLLSFEIGRVCNLAAPHPWCPANEHSRHSVTGCNGLVQGLADCDILDFAKSCKARGFAGLVAWHYYNEPMMHLDRILALGCQLREIGLSMGLWTNGTLIREDDLEWIEHFELVWITDHSPERREIYRRMIERFPGRVFLRPGGHDDRKLIYENRAQRCLPCWRPAVLEMIVDFVGDLHLCCADWRGECSIGNIRRDNHGEILDRWERSAAAAAAGELTICAKCQALAKSPAMHDEEFRL